MINHATEEGRRKIISLPEERSLLEHLARRNFLGIGWAALAARHLLHNQGMFSEDGTMLLSEWVAHTPPRYCQKIQAWIRVSGLKHPGAPLYIVPGSLPNSLEQNKAEVGSEQVATKHQYTFRLSPHNGLQDQ
jgi:hypothetical protein